MNSNWKHNTPEQIDLASQGKLCPACGSSDVKCVGSVPDGINMNYAYDCQACKEQWEGY